jgi:hypothetical protein
MGSFGSNPGLSISALGRDITGVKEGVGGGGREVVTVFGSSVGLRVVDLRLKVGVVCMGALLAFRDPSAMFEIDYFLPSLLLGMAACPRTDFRPKGRLFRQTVGFTVAGRPEEASLEWTVLSIREIVAAVASPSVARPHPAAVLLALSCPPACSHARSSNTGLVHGFAYRPLLGFLASMENVSVTLAKRIAGFQFERHEGSNFQLERHTFGELLVSGPFFCQRSGNKLSDAGVVLSAKELLLVLHAVTELVLGDELHLTSPQLQIALLHDANLVSQKEAEDSLYFFPNRDQALRVSPEQEFDARGLQSGEFVDCAEYSTKYIYSIRLIL